MTAYPSAFARFYAERHAMPLGVFRRVSETDHSANARMLDTVAAFMDHLAGEMLKAEPEFPRA